MLKKKVCLMCGINKPASEYNKMTKKASGLQTYCRTCQGDKSYGASLLKNYGMTQRQYNDLYNEQKGCCAICKRHQSELSYRLHVDHNHKTGKIRGLLCAGCNKKISVLESNRLNTLKKYLNKWK